MKEYVYYDILFDVILLIKSDLYTTVYLMDNPNDYLFLGEV
jgi:hypothetical protein